MSPAGLSVSNAGLLAVWPLSSFTKQAVGLLLNAGSVQRTALWLVGCVAGLVLVAGATWRYLESGAGRGEVALKTPQLERPIRVEVLNGCGAPKAAARLTRKARDLGIDVIHEGDAESFNFLETIILDRRGDMSKALQVAMILGVPNYAQQIVVDSYRLADVSVIIGHDHKELKLLEHGK